MSLMPRSRRRRGFLMLEVLVAGSVMGVSILQAFDTLLDAERRVIAAQRRFFATVAMEHAISVVNSKPGTSWPAAPTQAANLGTPATQLYLPTGTDLRVDFTPRAAITDCTGGCVRATVTVRYLEASGKPRTLRAVTVRGPN